MEGSSWVSEKGASGKVGMGKQIDPAQKDYFPPNVKRGYKTKTEILIGELFQYIIEKSPSLYLDYFIATVSLVFSPRVFPRPCSPIYQTSSTLITCWTHWFNQGICSLTLIYIIYHQIIAIFLLMLSFPSYLKRQGDKRRQTIWIISSMNRYSSCNPQLNSKGKILIKKNKKAHRRPQSNDHIKHHINYWSY